jgi:hypothetical protein
MFVWEQLALLRARDTSDSDHVEGPSQYQMPPPLCKRQHLERLWRCVGTEKTSERWTQGIRRICHGSIVSEYKRDKEAFVEWNNQKSFCPAAHGGGGEDPSVLPHPIEEYVDVFSPKRLCGKVRLHLKVLLPVGEKRRDSSKKWRRKRSLGR